MAAPRRRDWLTARAILVYGPASRGRATTGMSSLWADPAFQKDYEGCLVEVGFMEPFDQARIARESREVLKYVGCMRDRGWNLSDPEPSDSSLHPGLLDPPISIPKDPEAADQYYRDSADCGLPHYDEKDNLLPLGG